MSSDSAIAAFLSLLSKRSAVEQLKNAGFVKVSIEVMDVRAYFCPFQRRVDDFNFMPAYEIWLNEDDPIFEWINSVGHELAHALLEKNFSLYMAYNPMQWGKNLWATEREEEVFCDEFAEAWLRQGNNREELGEFLSPLAVIKELSFG